MNPGNPFLPSAGPGGGGRAGGPLQVGAGPLAGREGLEKGSSDGSVKELLIWLHRALMPQSSSHPRSISGTSETEKGGGKGEKAKGDEKKRWSGGWRGQRSLFYSFLPVSSKETEEMNLKAFHKNTRFSTRHRLIQTFLKKFKFYGPLYSVFNISVFHI